MSTVTYEALNGLRGIAALVVVLYHFSLRRLFGVDLGFIAVDLFFVLSGFVIAASYDRRFASGMSVGSFLRVRLIRLYPLFALGMAIGAVTSLCFRGTGGFPRLGTLFELACPFLMLPTPPSSGSGGAAALFPLNDPAWSLFLEVVVNLAYAASFKFWTTRRVGAAVVIALGCLACIYATTGTLYGDGGWNWRSLPFGFIRVSYAFLFGVLIHRLQPRLPQLPPSAAVVAVMLFLAMLDSPGRACLVCSILVGMPLSVTLAVTARPWPALAPVFRWAGALSYPLYAIHKPLHAMAIALVEKLGLDVPAVVFDIGFVALAVAAASHLERTYDRPLRAFLTRPSHRSAVETVIA